MVVEDNAGNVFLVWEAVTAAQLDIDLYFIGDGEEALRFFLQIDEGISSGVLSFCCWT